MISARTTSSVACTSSSTGPSPPYLTLFVISSVTSSRTSGRTPGPRRSSRSSSARRASNGACAVRGSSTLSVADMTGNLLSEPRGDLLPLPSDGPLTFSPNPASGGTRLAPLITYEEALALGEVEDRGEIEALVERAFEARRERFGDSTDRCSLVNAKSGGCAEDCGFCSQSRFAEAPTPMHAMMSPEQILEHARAAEAAGAHRCCMVTQGQGLSKKDYQNVLEGARLVAEHTKLKRSASIGHMSVDRATQLKDAGIQRIHHNVETAESYYDEVSTTVRYEGRIRTIKAVREAVLETC